MNEILEVIGMWLVVIFGSIGILFLIGAVVRSMCEEEWME